MIEIVYKDNTEEGGSGREIKTPKNIKQIGEGKGKCRIYIEDYVMNFARRTPEDKEGIRYGVLLGKVQRGEGASYVFVKGAVEAALEANQEETSEPALFSGDVWNSIYDEIKRYFDQTEIVGWFLSKPEQPVQEMPWLNKTHIGNFSGMDKVFLAVDRAEKEETFYVFDGTGLEKEESYYIYYDRNEEMQHYMAAKEPLAEQKGEEQEKQKKTFSFSVSSMLAVAALLAVVLLLNNYSSIANLFDRNQGGAAIGETENAKEAGNQVEKPGSQTMQSGAANNGSSVAAGEETTANRAEQDGDDNPASDNGQLADSNGEEDENREVNAEVEVRYYTVQKGETLYEICMRVYQNSGMVDTVREINGIGEDYLIVEGQKIILP